MLQKQLTGEADQNLLTGDVEFMSSAGVRGGISANAVMQETVDGPTHDAHVKLHAGDAIRGARAVRPKCFVSETGSAPFRPQSAMWFHEIGGKRQCLVNVQTGCGVDGPTPSENGSLGGGNPFLVRQVVSENGYALGKKRPLLNTNRHTVPGNSSPNGFARATHGQHSTALVVPEKGGTRKARKPFDDVPDLAADDTTMPASTRSDDRAQTGPGRVRDGPESIKLNSTMSVKNTVQDLLPGQHVPKSRSKHNAALKALKARKNRVRRQAVVESLPTNQPMLRKMAGFGGFGAPTNSEMQSIGGGANERSTTPPETIDAAPPTPATAKPPVRTCTSFGDDILCAILPEGACTDEGTKTQRHLEQTQQRVVHRRALAAPAAQALLLASVESHARTVQGRAGRAKIAQCDRELKRCQRLKLEADHDVHTTSAPQDDVPEDGPDCNA
jgi:hypothetical protein